MITVFGRDKTGTIILRDHRDDGAYVLLECREFAPGGDAGVVGVPSGEEEFPMVRKAVEQQTLVQAKRTNTKAFTLDIDISAMPSGRLQFSSHDFIERAALEAETTNHAAITPENADAWGFVAEQVKA